MDRKPTNVIKAENPELRPDGWERFEQAIDIAIKTPAIRKDQTKNSSVVKRKP